MPPRKSKQAEELISAGKQLEQTKYVLRLYVAGMTPRSADAIRRVTELCDKYLDERYELEIVDIYQKPALMAGEQIVAVPTLVKRLPLPLRKFIGDMHNEEKLLFGLDLVAGDPSAAPSTG